MTENETETKLTDRLFNFQLTYKEVEEFGEERFGNNQFYFYHYHHLHLLLLLINTEPQSSA